MSLRSLIKPLLPDRAVQHVRVNSLYLWAMNHKEKVRAYGLKDNARYAALAPFTRRRFAALNRNLPLTRIALAEDVEFNTCGIAREGHEWFAYRDPESVDEMRSFLRHSEELKCLLDVGALFGTFSLAFASRGGTVLAVEPSPEPLEVLTTNIALNPSFDVRAFQLALSDHNGSLTMQAEWKHFVASESGTQIKCARLDDFVSGQGVAPDAIKIDVEGHELAVLNGGVNYIRERKPIIFLEIDNWHAPDTTSEMISLLSSLGYAIQNTRGRLIRDPNKLLIGIQRVVCKPTSQAPA